MPSIPPSVFDKSPEVTQALQQGQPIVALESTIITHGLPRPANAEIARRIEDRVRAQGAVPATIALLDGHIHIGLTTEQLERLSADEAAVKVSVRDLGSVLMTGRTGATTVAATAHIAHALGIEVFATGGIGGVHRGAVENWDVSADLTVLARTPITVVSSGIKSILDVPATLERLETLGVGVCGYRTNRVPGFYLSHLDFPLDSVVHDTAAIVELIRLRRAVNDRCALLVFQPVAPEAQMDSDQHDRVLAAGLAYIADQCITGKDVTPALLSFFRTQTEGESLRVNTRLILDNATLAAQIAVELASSHPRVNP